MPSKVCKTDYAGVRQHRHHRSKKGKEKRTFGEQKSARYMFKKGKVIEEETLAEFKERVAYAKFKRQYSKSA